MPRVMSGIVARQRASCSWRAGPISGSVRQGGCWDCPVALFGVGVAKIPSGDVSCRLFRSPFTSASLSLRRASSFLLPSSVRMDFFLRLRTYGLQDELAVLRVDLERIAIVNGAIENAAGDTVLDLLLDDAPEGACPKLGVVAHFCQQASSGIGELQRDVPLC